MNYVFMGTPAFADSVLRALLAAGLPPRAVFAQPPRPSGRGMKLRAAPTAETAAAAGIPVHTPVSLREDETLASLRPELILTAAYGLILPQRILDIPRFALNLHASLLPRWRGAAPIQRCIEAGDTQTGITLMHMSKGLDEGDIAFVHALQIGADETAPQLHDRLAALAATTAIEAVHAAAEHRLPRTPQPAAGITYAEKIHSLSGGLTPELGVREAYDRFRAFCPRASFEQNGERVKIAEASLQPSADALPYPCRDGTLYLHKVQRPGGKIISGAEYARTHPSAER